MEAVMAPQEETPKAIVFGLLKDGHLQCLDILRGANGSSSPEELLYDREVVSIKPYVVRVTPRAA